ncbi:hypothetical protein HC823_01880, partial [Candidatus Gracilibacteria bacterium]|nr:hypothetical protein [Candidatus Gracilibacteria bacterium]
SSVRYPNGRMIRGKRGNRRANFFAPTDKKAFDLAMRRFYKAMVSEAQKPKKKASPKKVSVPAPEKEDAVFARKVYVEKLKETLQIGFSYAKKYGKMVWDLSQHLFLQAKDRVKKYQSQKTT